MKAILIPEAVIDRVKQTMAEAGDFYTVERIDGTKVVVSLWDMPTGRVCEILRDGDQVFTGTNEQFLGALIDPFYVAIAWLLGTTTLRFGTTTYYNVYGYPSRESECWRQWTPAEVAHHDYTGLLFTKSNPSPGMFRYTAVEHEHQVLEAIQQFIDTDIINDHLHKLLVRHGATGNWRYYPVGLVLRGINTGRRTPAEHRQPGRSRPPMTWLRWKRREILELIQDKQEI